MLDITNRIRNVLGNYRFVSYQMRIWKLKNTLRIAKVSPFQWDPEVAFYGLVKSSYSKHRPWRSLDLGSGSYPRNPFEADILHGCDIREDLDNNVIKANLFTEPIPIEQGSVDFITAYEFLEHIPRVLGVSNTTTFPFINLMNEIHRVLKEGGYFFAKTPAYPSQEAVQDPTHVNLISDSTMPYYFCWHAYGGPWARIYGFGGKFELARQRRSGPYLYTLLKKI